MSKMNWSKRQWKDVLSIVNGKNQKDVESDDGLYPIIGSGGTIGRAIKYLCEAGSTVVGRKGTINNPFFVDERFWNVDTAFGIQPGKSLIPKFLFYFCKGYNFKKLDKSTTIPSLAKTDLLKIEMPVPSLEEQGKIVNRIEELFSELDSAVETLKKTKEQLAVYRQSVLKEAFVDCEENEKMGNVATMIDPHPSHRTPPEYENGVPYIGVGDIDYKNNFIKIDEARKVNPSIYEDHLQRYTIRSGDFIMGKIGTIGKPYRLPLPQNYALSANVILIKPNSDIINPEYLFWQFSSPIVIEQLMEGKNETSQPAFGIQKARLLNIKMCNYDIQNKIVADIREKMSVCENIEKTVNDALMQADAMRQSILKKAFEGEL